MSAELNSHSLLPLNSWGTFPAMFVHFMGFAKESRKIWGWDPSGF